MYFYQTERADKIPISPEILQTVNGLTVNFLEELSLNKVEINNEVGMKSGQNYQQIMLKVNKLLKKDIVINTAHEEGEFISSMFLRSKLDGTN